MPTPIYAWPYYELTNEPNFPAQSKSQLDAIEATLASKVDPILIGSSADLNTYMTTGVYVQPSNAGASGGANYPVNPVLGAPYAGKLVVTAESTSGFVWQEYTDYHISNGLTWKRSYSAAWGAWTLAAGATPWISCTISSGFTAGTTAPSVRMVAGGTVQMRGLILVSGFVTGNNSCMTVPARFRPTGEWVYTSCVGNSGNSIVHKLVVETGGNVQIRTDSLPAANFQLWNISWSVYS